MLQDKIARSAARARILWLIGITIVSVLMVMYLPVWCVFLLPMFAFISYFVAMSAAATLLGMSLTEEELRIVKEAEFDFLTDTHLRQGEPTLDGVLEDAFGTVTSNRAALTEISPDGESSEPIGTYQGKQLFDWVKLQDPLTKRPMTFWYVGPAQMSDGSPILPRDRRVYVAIDGVLYARER